MKKVFKRDHLQGPGKAKANAKGRTSTTVCCASCCEILVSELSSVPCGNHAVSVRMPLHVDKKKELEQRRGRHANSEPRSRVMHRDDCGQAVSPRRTNRCQPGFTVISALMRSLSACASRRVWLTHHQSPLRCAQVGAPQRGP